MVLFDQSIKLLLKLSTILTFNSIIINSGAFWFQKEIYQKDSHKKNQKTEKYFSLGKNFEKKGYI